MNTSTNNTLFDLHAALRGMNKQDFANIGLAQVGYIRTVHIRGNDGFGIFAANGQMLDVFKTHHQAQAGLMDRDLDELLLQ